MSETVQLVRAWWRPRVRVMPLLTGLVLLAIPFYADGFWLQTGLFAMAAAIGAIGLNLLTGATGQLSMGHAFFLAIGAYGYVYFAADLPSVLAMVPSHVSPGARHTIGDGKCGRRKAAG